MIGYAICGSFCTHSTSLRELEKLARKYDVTPIISHAASSYDTRFGEASVLIEKVKKICDKDVITDIVHAEPLGPATPLDLLVICPCTGNTLAKMAQGITDTSVTMAAKAHMRRNGKVLIALATNDAMSANLSNIAAMLSRKGVYFVPMKQDDPTAKPHSLVADFDMLDEAVSAAFEGRQIRPLFK